MRYIDRQMYGSCTGWMRSEVDKNPINQQVVRLSILWIKISRWINFISMAELCFNFGNYQVINKVAMRTFPGKLTLSRPELFLIIFTLHRSNGCWHILLSHGPQYATLFCLINISPSRHPNLLHSTYWEEMAANSHNTFSDAFSWIKLYEFWLKCHWNLLLRCKLTVFQHWIR